jgi:hypothetical protein
VIYSPAWIEIPVSGSSISEVVIVKYSFGCEFGKNKWTGNENPPIGMFKCVKGRDIPNSSVHISGLFIKILTLIGGISLIISYYELEN